MVFRSSISPYLRGFTILSIDDSAFKIARALVDKEIVEIKTLREFLKLVEEIEEVL